MDSSQIECRRLPLGSMDGDLRNEYVEKPPAVVLVAAVVTGWNLYASLVATTQLDADQMHSMAEGKAVGGRNLDLLEVVCMKQQNCHDYHDQHY